MNAPTDPDTGRTTASAERSSDEATNAAGTPSARAGARTGMRTPTLIDLPEASPRKSPDESRADLASPDPELATRMSPSERPPQTQADASIID